MKWQLTRNFIAFIYNQFVRLRIKLTFTTLLVNSADDKLIFFFLFFPQNMFQNFMQFVSSGDNLHKM